MTQVLLHFLAGTAGALFVFLVFTRLSDTPGFSAPFGVVIVGLNCAVLAHYVSPWATPAVIAAYVVLSAMELWQDRKARKRQRARELQ